MQRETRQRARGGRHGPAGRSAIARSGKRRKWSNVSPQIFWNRQSPPGRFLLLLLFFFVWEIPVKWLLIYAKSNQRLIHNAWATRYQFCNAFGLLDAITNAADEILALLPSPVTTTRPRRRRRSRAMARWKCEEDNRKPEQHPLPAGHR